MKTKEIVGTAAIILQLTGNIGNTDIQTIQNHTNIDLSTIYIALGWLVRGGNIILDDIDGKLVVNRVD